jgi:hypothetical protein
MQPVLIFSAGRRPAGGLLVKITNHGNPELPVRLINNRVITRGSCEERAGRMEPAGKIRLRVQRTAEGLQR